MTCQATLSDVFLPLHMPGRSYLPWVTFFYHTPNHANLPWVSFIYLSTYLPFFLVCTGAKVPQERKLKGTKVVCGANVPRVRKFHGTKVLGTFAPEERKLHRSESSMERKFLDFSLPGVNVPRNESSTGAKVLSMVFSLP